MGDFDIVKAGAGYDVYYGGRTIHFDTYMDAVVFVDSLREARM